MSLAKHIAIVGYVGNNGFKIKSLPISLQEQQHPGERGARRCCLHQVVVLMTIKRLLPRHKLVMIHMAIKHTSRGPIETSPLRKSQRGCLNPMNIVSNQVPQIFVPKAAENNPIQIPSQKGLTKIMFDPHGGRLVVIVDCNLGET